MTILMENLFQRKTLDIYIVYQNTTTQLFDLKMPDFKKVFLMDLVIILLE